MNECSSPSTGTAMVRFRYAMALDSEYILQTCKGNRSPLDESCRHADLELGILCPLLRTEYDRPSLNIHVVFLLRCNSEFAIQNSDPTPTRNSKVPTHNTQPDAIVISPENVSTQGLPVGQTLYLLCNTELLIQHGYHR